MPRADFTPTHRAVAAAAALLLAIGATPAVAQMAAGGMAAPVGQGAADQPVVPQGPPPRLVVQPRVHFETGLRSNGEYLLLGRTTPVARATAGIGIRSNGGRIRGELSYDGGAFVELGGNRTTTMEHNLAARGSVEVVDRHGFIDVMADSHRVGRSPFSMQPTSGGFASADSVQYSHLRIAPRWQDYLGWDTDFKAAAYYDRQWMPTQFVTNTAPTAAGGGTNAALTTIDRSSGLSSHGISAGLVHRAARFGWSLDASADWVRRTSLDSSSDRLLSASLLGRIPELDLQWTLTAGREHYQYGNEPAIDSTTWGLGLDWKPSPRLRGTARYDRRAYGPTHAVSLQYRAPLWDLSIADSRNLNTNALIGVPGQQTTLFDLYMTRTRPMEPDLGRRVDLVLAMLARAGLDPLTKVVTPGFLASGRSTLRTSQIGGSVHGVRTNLSMTLARSRSAQLVSLAEVYGLPTTGAWLTTTGVSIDATHNLTRTMKAGAGFGWSKSEGIDILGLERASVQTNVYASVGLPLDAKTTVGVMARRLVWRSGGATIFDNQLSATYDQHF